MEQNERDERLERQGSQPEPPVTETPEHEISNVSGTETAKAEVRETEERPQKMQEGPMAKPKKKRSAGKVILTVLLVLVLVVVLAVGGLLLWLKYGIQTPEVPTVDAPANSSQPVEGGEDDEPVQVLQRRDQVYTCLIFGMDSGYGNTDTIMVATFDVANKTIGLMSIPRDTIVTEEYESWYNKINAAYSRGGEEELEAEVEELLGIPIDYYVKIRLSAFKKLVNAVGGVWYNVPFDMDYDDEYQDLHIHLEKGYQLLNGEQAMGLVRYRQGNDHTGYGDVGRVGTQQEFMIAMLSQVLENATLSTLPDLLDILLNYVETNASTNDMLYFAKAVYGIDLETSVKTGMLPSTWTSPYMWVQSEEALAMLNELLNPYDTPITEEMVEFITRDEEE